MVNIEKLESMLYKTLISCQNKRYIAVWETIKSNPQIFSEAVKVKRDKFDERNTLNCLAICDAMLIDYDNVDKIAYEKLINEIYSDKDIARIVIRGASNGGFSFLLMTLWNYNLKLTEQQKEFAVSEAMNKIGTIRYLESQISDYDYMKIMFSVLSNTQAHGTGPFDIRYHILKNPNWSDEEKEKLIYDFWQDEKEYEYVLDAWEWAIINDEANYKNDVLPSLDKSCLYEYTYEYLSKFYNDKQTTDRIWSEISFCRKMRELRPVQQEILLKNKKH